MENDLFCSMVYLLHIVKNQVFVLRIAMLNYHRVHFLDFLLIPEPCRPCQDVDGIHLCGGQKEGLGEGAVPGRGHLGSQEVEKLSMDAAVVVDIFNMIQPHHLDYLEF